MPHHTNAMGCKRKRIRTVDGESVLGADTCHIPRHRVPNGLEDGFDLDLSLQTCVIS
jgi:hypothetical protein